ncbi:MAG: phage tail tube protein [Candidatus Hodarchaeales archaeon]
MGLYVGAGGSAGIVKESSYGGGGTPDTFIELINESVKCDFRKIASEHVFSHRSIYKYYSTVQDVNGSFTFEVNPDNIGLLLYLALGVEADPAQVDTSNAYDHDFTPAGLTTDLGSFMLEIDRGGGSGNAFQYKGCKVDTLSFEAARDAILQATVGLFGQTETDDQTGADLDPSTKLPFVFGTGEVQIDSSTVAFVRSFSLQYSNHLDADGGFVFDGNPYRNHLYKTVVSLTGSMEVEYTSDSDAERDAYRDNTQRQLTFIFTSTEAIESGYYYTLTIDIPKVHYLNAHPQITGRDSHTFTIDFEAVYDSTNFVKITLRDGRNNKWSA